MHQSIITVLLLGLFQVTRGETCYNKYDVDDDDHLDCQYGCCGSGYSVSCCSVVPLITGGIFAGCFFLAIIVYLVWFCYTKQNRSRGAVVSPRNNGQQIVTVVNYDQPVYGKNRQPNGGQHGQPHGGQHGQPNGGQPMQGSSNGMYPPPQSSMYPPPPYMYPPPPAYSAVDGPVQGGSTLPNHPAYCQGQ